MNTEKRNPFSAAALLWMASKLCPADCEKVSKSAAAVVVKFDISVYFLRIGV